MKPSNQSLARKYCFKATTTMYRKRKPVGIFTGYDYRVQIAEEVQKACEAHCLDPSEDKHCGDSTLTILEVCPVELQDEITFRFVDQEKSDEL